MRKPPLLRRLLRRPVRAPIQDVGSPVFVVGSVRTGSTYLTRLLNCHPNLVIGSEDRVPRLLLDFLAVIDTPPGTVRSRHISTDPERRRQMGHEGVLGFHDQPDLLAGFRSGFQSRFLELIRDFYAGPRAAALQDQLKVDKRGAGRWGDKLGTYWPGSQLEEAFPASQVVHILRDGRDVVVSMRQFAARQPKAPWQEYTFGQLCDSWVQTTSRIRRDAEGLGPERYLEVRYETLLREEEKRLFEIFAFLGEDPAAARPFYRKASGERLRKLFEQHGTSADPASSVGRWRDELSSSEKALAQEKMGPLLNDLGY